MKKLIILIGLLVSMVFFSGCDVFGNIFKKTVEEFALVAADAIALNEGLDQTLTLLGDLPLSEGDVSYIKTSVNNTRAYIIEAEDNSRGQLAYDLLVETNENTTYTFLQKVNQIESIIDGLTSGDVPSEANITELKSVIDNLKAKVDTYN